MAKQHTPEDLTEHIAETSVITCTKCGAEEEAWSDGAEDRFFNNGWRSTQRSCYCPDCAPKYLKL